MADADTAVGALERIAEGVEDPKRAAESALQQMGIETPFGRWFDDLQRTAVCEFNYTFRAAQTMNPDDWRPYYDDGESPSEALSKDARYA